MNQLSLEEAAQKVWDAYTPEVFNELSASATLALAMLEMWQALERRKKSMSEILKMPLQDIIAISEKLNSPALLDQETPIQE